MLNSYTFRIVYWEYSSFTAGLKNQHNYEKKKTHKKNTNQKNI